MFCVARPDHAWLTTKYRCWSGDIFQCIYVVRINALVWLY